MPELQAIQAFLVAGGRERPMVPKRERSLELFGDEKRLDALVKRSLFVRGHLSLDLLRCFEVPPPLVWEAGPPKSRGRAILTVENHHTWHSFCRWNRTAGAYAAVVYGGGDRFVGAAADLERVSEATNANGRVDYFGDLDGRGLKIPVAACKMTHLPILPAARWYDILLDPVKVPPDRGDVHVPPGLVAWLAREHREPTARLLSHGMRLPQEWVGWEVLGGSLP